MASKSEHEFINWIKVQMALCHFKSTLIPYFTKHFHHFYMESVMSVNSFCKLTYICNSCDIRILQQHNKESGNIPCKEHGACDKMFDLITEEHMFSRPNWSNTRCALWADRKKGPWEIMKCFVDKPGINDALTIEEAGVAELIQIFINSKSLRKSFGAIYDLIEIGEFRNKLYHSGAMIISEQVCDWYIRQLERVLFHIMEHLRPFFGDPLHIRMALSKLRGNEITDDQIKNDIQNQNLLMDIQNIRQLEEKASEQKCSIPEYLTKYHVSINEIRRVGPHPKIPGEVEKEYYLKEYADDDLSFEELPMRFKLRSVVERFGRKSPQLENLCNIVYSSIRKKLSVTRVYAAYQVTDEMNLTFVVTVDSDKGRTDVEKHLKELAIEHVIKSPQPKNSHNEDTDNEDLPIQEMDIIKLRKCIELHAEQLFAKHKYLSIIEGFMHKLNNQASEIDNKYEARLAMFVHAQGYIPIDEEPIKKNIDGIQVDVREGVFMPLAGQHADDFLDNISMGCQISRNEQDGTLGLFFEHANDGLCGITCAHVLLSNDELQQCKSGSEPYKGSDVYQPNSLQDGNVIGQLKKAIITPNDGLEIAIFSIQKRIPKNGKFPKPKKGKDNDITYSSGKTYEPRRNQTCVKFGITSEYTRGFISILPVAISFENTGLMLRNLMIILPQSGKFAKLGDSGAPVFVEDNGEQVCIGIVCGINSGNTRVYMTRIKAILKALKISQFKTFKTLKKNKCILT